VKNQWNRKKRLKPLRSSQANRSRTASGLAAGGKGMGEGKLRISGAASDEFHGEESDKEGAR
jgi:hypothetical protein